MRIARGRARARGYIEGEGHRGARGEGSTDGEGGAGVSSCPRKGDMPSEHTRRQGASMATNTEEKRSASANEPGGDEMPLRGLAKPDHGKTKCHLIFPQPG